jgi:hypothetical protein
MRESKLALNGGLRRALGGAAAVTVLLLALFLFRAPHFGLALRFWLVSLVAIFVSALFGRVLAGLRVGDGPGPEPIWRRRRWWRGAPSSGRVEGLEELEHAVEFSLTTAFDVHYRLRPHLVRVAAHRLGRRGVEMDAQPVRASELLGREAWDLVRPDRPAPERRNARGLELARLRRVVDRLDAI